MTSVQPPAVVVGLCAHGLAITRELHRAGIRVIAIESNRNLPGIHTRMADVHLVDSIARQDLCPHLIALARMLGNSCRPVLFLTNDLMVKAVGEQIDTIAQHYIVSWASRAQTLLTLLDKGEIEARCKTAGLNYPRSAIASSAAELITAARTFKLPIILKPLQPLSTFKTLIIQDLDQLPDHQPLISSALPVLLQEYISGDDSRIHFAALCLDQGKPVARFEGRKLHSRPLGHTTIGVSHPSDEVHQLALRFFNGLELSGAVSLELKRAPDSSLWVIEPTVGRTDFWSDLCAANGVPLAVSEYSAATSIDIGKYPKQTISRIWINAGRFPAALFWIMKNHPSKILSKKRFTYLDRQDPKPFFYALKRYSVSFFQRLRRKIIRTIQALMNSNRQNADKHR